MEEHDDPIGDDPIENATEYEYDPETMFEAFESADAGFVVLLEECDDDTVDVTNTIFVNPDGVDFPTDGSADDMDEDTRERLAQLTFELLAETERLAVHHTMHVTEGATGSLIDLSQRLDGDDDAIGYE